MKRFLVISALLLTGAFVGAAKAQMAPVDPPFPVMPYQLGGAGSPYRMGFADGIGWVAWTHTNNTRLAMNCWAVGYEVIHPETSHMKTPIQVAKAYWVTNVFAHCDTDPYFRPAYRAARAAFGLK